MASGKPSRKTDQVQSKRPAETENATLTYNDFPSPSVDDSGSAPIEAFGVDQQQSERDPDDEYFMANRRRGRKKRDKRDSIYEYY